MLKNVDKMGIWTEENDPRVTCFGKFLRKTAMDEFKKSMIERKML